jgi:hypothetical protein
MLDLTLFAPTREVGAYASLKKLASVYGPRGQFFKSCIDANFVPRRQLERRCHCCIGANSPCRRKLAFKKLTSGTIPELINLNATKTKFWIFTFILGETWVYNPKAEPVGHHDAAGNVFLPQVKFFPQVEFFTQVKFFSAG